MADLIQGTVSYIMDRRTFSIDVTHVGARNADKYLTSETVRIRQLMNSDKTQVNLGETRKELETILKQKSVKCRVDHRDSYHRIIADVYLLS